MKDIQKDIQEKTGRRRRPADRRSSSTNCWRALVRRRTRRQASSLVRRTVGRQMLPGIWNTQRPGELLRKRR